MNWIQCESGEVLGTRYIRRFKVEAGAVARTVITGDLARYGYENKTTHHALPGSGWLIIAWCGGVNAGPRCVACYGSEAEAQQVLAGIFEELGEGSKAVDVPAIRARLQRRS